MPIAIYARISTAKEGSEATRRQIDMCHDFLAKRPDLNLYSNNSNDPKLGGYRGAFHDEGKSAWKTGVKRPAWEAVAALAVAGAIDGVLAYASDRIHRRHLEMMMFVSGVLEAGNGLVLYFANGNEPQNFNSVGGRLAAGMMAIMANAEVETLTQRVTDEKHAAAKAGRWNGGRAPFGYRAVRPVDDPEGKFIIEQDPTKAPELVRAVKDYLSGKSFLTVHNNFNQATGQNLDYNSFLYSLASPAMAGKRMHLPQAKRAGKTAREICMTPRFIEDNATFYPALWDAIIPFTQWELLRDKLVNNRGDARRGKTPQQSLLAGLVYCASCGSKMSNDGTTYRVDCHGNSIFMQDGITPAIKHYPTYRCVRNMGGCGKMQIGASGLDPLIEAEFLKILPRAIKQGRFTPVQELEARLIAAQNERSAIDTELDELYVDWKSGKVNEGTYDRLKGTKDRAAAVLASEISALRMASDDQSRLLTADEVYESMDVNQRNGMLRQVIEHIEIRKIIQPAGRRNIMHAERVSVLWNLSGKKFQTYGVNQRSGKEVTSVLVPQTRKPSGWDSMGLPPASPPTRSSARTVLAAVP